MKKIVVLCMFINSGLGGLTIGNKKQLKRNMITMNNDAILVDLTHTIHEKVPSWNGEQGFELHTGLDYKDCNDEYKFRAQMFEAQAGIGTHLDAPSHCIEGGMNVSGLPLESLYAPCVVIDVSEKANEQYQVSAEDVESFEKNIAPIASGAFVIFYTGWSKKWNDPQGYRNDLIFPSVSKEAVQALLEKDIVGIGIDTLSPDCPSNGFPVHNLILGAGKYIIENIANADKLPLVGAHILVTPLKIEGGTESPVRLIGFIPV